jgi:hypothetical protein
MLIGLNRAEDARDRISGFDEKLFTGRSNIAGQKKRPANVADLSSVDGINDACRCWLLLFFQLRSS